MLPKEKSSFLSIRRCCSKSNGITLIALVITIIVLLILAGVALSSVLSQDGIFSRAKQGADKYGQAKARETLEMALGEAQMQKYEEGLNDEELDEQIKKVGSLLSKEDPDSKYQLVIVDGYIFEIDRSVPKVVDYKGPADGIIITSSVKQNGDWQNPVATVTGTITKYGGGTVLSSSATATNGVTIPSDFPTAGGSYTISNITTDTDITITAKDSEGYDPVTEVIKVRLVRDTTPPTLSNAKAEATGMKIKISVKAVDNESGVQTINYNVTPNTITPASGEITSEQVIELTATEETEYTVTFTAEDNAGNISKVATAKATTIDGITVAEAKKLIDGTNLKNYIGTKILDYNPEAGGTWRVFYYDTSGEFGVINTLYLKRDYVANDIALDNYKNHTPSDGGAMMKKMNPLWAASTAHNPIDQANEHCAAWLCDPNEWKEYKTENSSYAIGSPSLEMYMKAYNVWKGSNNALVYKLDDTERKLGYLVGANGSYSNSGYYTNNNTVEVGPGNIFMTPGGNNGEKWWLASPTSSNASNRFTVSVYFARVDFDVYSNAYGVCPVVPIDQ